MYSLIFPGKNGGVKNYRVLFPGEKDEVRLYISLLPRKNGEGRSDGVSLFRILGRIRADRALERGRWGYIRPAHSKFAFHKKEPFTELIP